MSLTFDPLNARLRHEEMLLEVERRSLAREVARANGTETLLGRMVKLLSRSSRPSLQPEISDRAQHQHRLADAKSS